MKKVEEAKKWRGWFVPVPSKSYKCAHFIMSKICANQVSPRVEEFSSNVRKRIVVSVPAQVGKAVQRNKLRRSVLNFLSPQISQTAEEGIWVRVSPRHKMPQKLDFSSWKKQLSSGLDFLSFKE